MRYAESVIVLGSPCPGSGKAVSYLKSLDRANGQHGLGQVGIQLLKYRLSCSGRHTADDTLHHSSAGVLPGHQFLQPGLCLCCCPGIRHVQPVIPHLVQVKALLCNTNAAHLSCIRPDRNSKAFQKPAGNGARRHTGNGLPA